MLSSRLPHRLIKFIKISFFVSGELTDTWEDTTLQTILSNYAIHDIYNADEFGLFYQALPNHTIHFKDKKCTEGQHSKIRLSCMAAANMIGDKLPMFVIGASNNPLCFKGVKQLPCRYRGQTKSWMDSQLFEEWIRELDDQFEIEKRKVALIVDNSAAHPEINGLKSIDVFFLPPNSTTILQPMHQGVVRSLKAKYRTKVVQKLTDAVDSKQPLPQISMLCALKMLVLAWAEVSSNTIQNSFKKAHFCEIEGGDLSEDPSSAFEESIMELKHLDESLLPKDISLMDFASFDDGLTATQPPLIKGDTLTDIEQDQSEKDEKSDISEVIERPSSSKIRGAIDSLMNFSMITGSTELQTLTMKASKTVEFELANKCFQEDK